MARECKNCGKSSQVEWKRKLLRGNYNPTHKVRKYPNLQQLKLSDGSRVKVCSRCIKTYNKTGKLKVGK